MAGIVEAPKTGTVQLNLVSAGERALAVLLKIAESNPDNDLRVHAASAILNVAAKQMLNIPEGMAPSLFSLGNTIDWWPSHQNDEETS
jgi:hypothetical protein